MNYEQAKQTVQDLEVELDSIERLLAVPCDTWRLSIHDNSVGHVKMAIPPFEQQKLVVERQVAIKTQLEALRRQVGEAEVALARIFPPKPNNPA